MVAIKEVIDTEDIVIVTSDGMVIRQHAADIRVAGRNTQRCPSHPAKRR